MFNLIATTYRGVERLARRELRQILVSLGDNSAKTHATSVSGLITAKTSLSPFEAIAGVIVKYLEDPFSISYLIRIIPVEAVTETELTKITEVAEQLTSRIGDDESFRITVEKRRTSIHNAEIIRAIAKKVERRVGKPRLDNLNRDNRSGDRHIGLVRYSSHYTPSTLNSLI